jgi:hypothetical protein
MEVTKRRGRRRKKLLDELKERRGYSHLKEEALDRAMWRNRFGEALNLSSDRILNDDDIPATLTNIYVLFLDPNQPHRTHTDTYTTGSKLRCQTPTKHTKYL